MQIACMVVRFISGYSPENLMRFLQYYVFFLGWIVFYYICANFIL